MDSQDILCYVSVNSIIQGTNIRWGRADVAGQFCSLLWVDAPDRAQ